MTVDVAVVVEGLGALEYMTNLPRQVELAAQRALNRAASRARTRASKVIREQVNFPARYVGPSEGRLKVGRKAGRGSLIASVKGRDRPTSLARFVVGSTKPVKSGGELGLNVSVKRGGGRSFIGRAFIVNLRSGNRGLAVRTDGGPPPGAYKPTRLGPSGKLWLLYGPSVDQVLRSAASGNGVFQDIGPEIAEWLEREFQRLLKVEID